MSCCAWQGHIFLKKSFCLKNGENGPKIGQNTGFFEFIGKYDFFLNLVYKENLITFAVLLHNSHTWKKSVFRDRGQYALDQSDCSIFKLTISLEQNDEKAWFFAYWCRFLEIKSWLKNIGVNIGQKWVWSLWSQDTKTGCISRRNQ